MNVYKRKRIKSGLSQSDIASELGIDIYKYILIERGDIKMPKNLIDRFNQIVNRGVNENKLLKLEREKKVNNWYDEMTSEEDGTYKLYKKMQEFNIETLKELAPLIGYKDSSIFSKNFKNDSNNVPYEFKNKLYTFFENELNMQPKNKPKPKVVKRDYTIKKTELHKWYKKIDVKKYLEENSISSYAFSEITGISPASIYRMTNKKVLPRHENLIKLKEYFDKLEKEEQKEMMVKEKTVTKNLDLKDVDESSVEFFNPYKERLITKYTNLLNFNYKKVDEINRQIKALQDELIALTKEKTIYKNVLKDIKEEN